MLLAVLIISTAHAQTATASQPDTLTMLLPMIAIFVLFYFLLIRPQQKRAKEAKAMIEALQKGDEVVTAGGIVGKITSINENYLGLEIANQVEIHVQRQAVQLLLPKGTIKNL